MAFKELEVLDHRMAVEAPELARDAQQNLPRLRALELDLAFAGVGFDARQPLDEIGLPGRPAELAVGDRLQADGLLLADQGLDLAVLDVLQGIAIDFAARALATRLLQRGGAEQAADVVGAEGRSRTLHDDLPDFRVTFSRHGRA